DRRGMASCTRVTRACLRLAWSLLAIVPETLDTVPQGAVEAGARRTGGEIESAAFNRCGKARLGVRRSDGVVAVPVRRSGDRCRAARWRRGARIDRAIGRGCG